MLGNDNAAVDGASMSEWGYDENLPMDSDEMMMSSLESEKH